MRSVACCLCNDIINNGSCENVVWRDGEQVETESRVVPIFENVVGRDGEQVEIESIAVPIIEPRGSKRMARYNQQIILLSNLMKCCVMLSRW